MGIDGGSVESAAVHLLFDTPDSLPKLLDHVYLHNTEFLDWIKNSNADLYCFECLLSYGGASQSVVDTAFWTGRFFEAAPGKRVEGLNRKMVLSTLLSKVPKKGGDSKVRSYVVDMYGGENQAVGNKKIGYGPLHKVTGNDKWQAFGVAIAAHIHLNENLEFWDLFYTDSEEFHTNREKRAETKKRREEKKAKVGNPDLFK